MSLPESFARVRAAADAVGRTVAEEKLEALGRFADLLLRWNARINLTGARDAQELWDDHLPDAVVLSGLVQGTELLDVGSGGGLPGVPFAILRPDVRVTLLEPRNRRVAFLRAARQELGLSNVSVVEGRVEAPGWIPPAPLRPGFGAVSARATFPPEDWLEIGRRLAAPGGQIVAFLNDDPGAGMGVPERVVRYAVGHERGRVMATFRAG